VQKRPIRQEERSLPLHLLCDLALDLEHWSRFGGRIPVINFTLVYHSTSIPVAEQDKKGWRSVPYLSALQKSQDHRQQLFLAGNDPGRITGPIGQRSIGQLIQDRWGGRREQQAAGAAYHIGDQQ